MSNTVAVNTANVAIGAGFGLFEAWAGGAEGMDLLYGALGGGLGGLIGGKGLTLRRQFLTGMVAGGGGNVWGQLVANNYDFSKVDLFEAGITAIAGGGLSLYGNTILDPKVLKRLKATPLGMTLGLGMASGIADLMISYRVKLLYGDRSPHR
jgi:hypothetical protein